MPWGLILLKLFCGVDFSAHQVVVCFTTPHDTKSLSFHQHFGGAPPRIVIRRFDESVCASRPYDQQITGLNGLQRIILSEKVSGFANRANDIHNFFCRGGDLILPLIPPGTWRTAGVIGCSASYKTGRIRSFMAASTITKVFPRFFFT